MKRTSSFTESSTSAGRKVFSNESNVGSVTDVDLTPMINVVFLLLVFFMVLGVFKTQDSSQVELPESSVGIINNDVLTSSNIVITKNNQLRVNGELITVEEIRLKLQPVDSEVALWVNADAGSSAAQVAAILQQLSNAGFTQVFLQTKKIPSGEP